MKTTNSTRHGRGLPYALKVVSTLLLSIICGTLWITCGTDGSDCYLPLNGGNRWESKDWTSRHITATEGSPFQYQSIIEVTGTYRADNRDWQVIEFSYAPDGFIPEEAQGRVLMQANAERLEIYGVTPDELGGGASFMKPSSGPLVFNWGEATKGYTRNLKFDVEVGFNTVELEVDATVEDIGVSYSNSIGSFNDVMVLNLSIEIFYPYPETIEVKLWLARGYGFIKAEHTKSTSVVGGDLESK